jgi:plasmid stabilization system protein ParE
VSWRLIVEAAAEAEILETAEWYGRRNPAARERFLAAVDDALAAIENNPLQYQVVRGVVRRVLVRRFPYALLYSISEDQVVVTVCFPTHRDPGRWHARFPS